MPNRSHRRITAVLLTLGTVGFFAVLHWVAEPKPSSGNPALLAPLALIAPTPPPPVASLVFVIDSSSNMIPWTGPNYFDLAKEGIIEFLNRPGFPTDPSIMSFEIAVIQFTASTAREYISSTDSDYGIAHWVPLTTVASTGDRDALIAAVDRLRPSYHFSASLLELGIREATSLLDLPGVTGDKQIILLTTGEYRLSYEEFGHEDLCPPACYSHPDGEGCTWSTIDCDTDQGTCFNDEFCNRACHVRYFADMARAANIRVSALRLGYDWQDLVNPSNSACHEADIPYVDPSPPYAPNPCVTPVRPDRGGLLNEITTCNEMPGSYVRINPFLCFSSTTRSQCDPDTFVPGDAYTISDSIAKLICDLGIDTRNPDGDFLDMDSEEPIYSLLDNCPDDFNSRQRDCNEDHIGDACQFGTAACNGTGDDDDDDGLCNALDTCDGGDDCLVTLWMRQLNCSGAIDPLECDNDCNHNEELDACDAARELGGYLNYPDDYDPNFNVTLPFYDHDSSPFNGLPDCCDDGSCDCDPIPTLCDLDALPDSRYVEDFESFAVGDLDSSDNDAHGWWQTKGMPSGVVTIVSDPNDGSYLELGLDPNIATDGTESYFVEGPGIQIPAYTCKQATDDIISNPTYENVVDTRPWGTMAIDMEVNIDLQQDGSVIDLYILDSNESEWKDAVRVHLQFAGNQRSYEKLDRTTMTTTMTAKGTYVSGEWFTFSIVLDMSEYFALNGSTCDFAGSYYGAVRLLPRPQWFPDQMAWQGETHELGVLRLYSSRGMQLFISSNNKAPSSGANVFRIGRVEVRPTNSCAFKAHDKCIYADATEPCMPRGDPPNSGLPCPDDFIYTCGDDYSRCSCCRSDDPVRESKCQEYALCVADPTWIMRLSTCGDDRIHPGVEMCDDGPLVLGDEGFTGCNATCTGWVCDDGILAGDEECEPGMVAGDGCQSDCTCLCGDGKLCGSEACDVNDSDCVNCQWELCGNGIIDDGEQCDPNACGGADCAQNCTWKDGFYNYPHPLCE